MTISRGGVGDRVKIAGIPGGYVKIWGKKQGFPKGLIQKSGKFQGFMINWLEIQGVSTSKKIDILNRGYNFFLEKPNIVQEWYV